MTMATEDTQSAQSARPLRSNLLRKQSEIEEVDEEDTSPGSDQSDTTITAGTETPRVTGGSPESGSPDDLKNTSTEISHEHNHKHNHISPKIQKLTRSEALCEDCASPPLDPLQSTASTCSTDSSSSGIGSKSQTSGSTTSSFRGRLEKDGSQSSEAGTSSSLSRDSSVDTPYKDSTGIDLEDFIRKTLNKTPKDRSMLIKLEGDLVKFIREPKHHYLKFPQMSSYDRMLVHRIAAFFGLDHNVDQTGKCVIVNKTQNTRIPDFSFQEHIYSSESKPKMLLKRGGGSFDELQSKNLEKPSLEDTRAKSLEERQQRYDEARNRIFTVEEVQPTGYSQEDASVTGIVMKQCRPQSLGSSREDHTWSSTESSGYGTDSSCKNRIPVPKANSFGGMGSFIYSHLKSPMRGGSLSKADSMCSGGATVNLGNITARQIILSTSPTCSQSDNSSMSGSSSSGLAPSPQQQTGSMPVPAPSPQKFYWVASDLNSIPPGSVVINPQTGQPFINPDGSAYRYTPGQPLPQPGPSYPQTQQTTVYHIQQQQQQQQSVEWTGQQSQDSTSSGELCQQMSVMRVTPQSSTESCGEQAVPAQTQPQPQPQPMMMGQNIPQQFPQSPVQGVPGTQTIIYPGPQNAGSQPVRYMCSMNYSTPASGGSIPQAVGPGEGQTPGQPAQQQYTQQFVHSYPCNQMYQSTSQGQGHIQAQGQGQEVAQPQGASYSIPTQGESTSVAASSGSNGVSYQVQYSQGSSVTPNQSHMYYMVQSHQPQMGYFHGQGVSSYQTNTPPSQQSANVSNLNNPVPMLNMGQPVNIGNPVNVPQGPAQGVGTVTPSQPFITYQPQPAHVYQPQLTSQIRPVSPQVVPFPSVQAHTHMPAQTYQTVFRPNMQMPMQVQQQQPQGAIVTLQVAPQGSVNVNQVSANPSQPLNHVTVSAKGVLYDGQVPKVETNGENKEQYSGGVTLSGPHQQVSAPVFRPTQPNQGVQYRPQVQQSVQLTQPQQTQQQKPRSSVPSSPVPKPQRVKKSRSRDSYVSQNSVETYFCKNEIEKETDETVDTDKETTGNDIAGERTNESDKSNSLSDYLNTRSFDKVVAAALDVCAPYMYDIDDLKSPSNGIKIKYDLKRVICAYWGMIVKKDPHSEKAKELQTLLELMSLEWGERITKLARAVMVRRNLTVKNELPAPADVEKLTKYIINQLNKTPLTEENYFRLAQLTQTRLLLYNKRRSGEIEGAKLANYAAKTRKLDDLDQSLIGDLTDVEKFLLSTQDLMKVRGKGNRPVPALIPLDAMKPLEFLSRRETRIKVGVGSENPYLFPNTGGKFTRSYGNLKKTCQEVHLEAPARITSVSMRKYTATLTQMLNLDKYQVDWVCRHLGHTKNVHKMYYRQMSGLIERTQLTKLLLLQDLNLTTKFKGRSLEEIDLKDIIFPNSTDEERAVSSEPTSSDDLSEVMNEAISNHERNDVMVDDIVFESDDDDDDEEASSSEEEEMKPVKKKITKKIQAPIKRQKFDEMEMSEIHKFFQTYLNMGITPKTKAIEAAKKKAKNRMESYG